MRFVAVKTEEAQACSVVFQSRARLGVPRGTLGLAGADLHPYAASSAHDAPFRLGVRGGTAPRQPLPGTREAWPHGVSCSRPVAGREPARRRPTEAAAEGLVGSVPEGKIRVVVVGHVVGLGPTTSGDWRRRSPGVRSISRRWGLPPYASSLSGSTSWMGRSMRWTGRSVASRGKMRRSGA